MLSSCLVMLHHLLHPSAVYLPCLLECLALLLAGHLPACLPVLVADWPPACLPVFAADWPPACLPACGRAGGQLGGDGPGVCGEWRPVSAAEEQLWPTCRTQGSRDSSAALPQGHVLPAQSRHPTQVRWHAACCRVELVCRGGLCVCFLSENPFWLYRW